MLNEQWLEVDLSAYKSASTTLAYLKYKETYEALGVLQSLVQDLMAILDHDQYELKHLAWRATKVAEDMSFTASPGGEAQRRRLAARRDQEVSDESWPPVANQLWRPIAYAA
jgi:hypothetical protein